MRITIDVTDKGMIVNNQSAHEWLELVNPGDIIDFVAPDGSIVDTVRCCTPGNEWIPCTDCGCSRMYNGSINYISGLCDIVQCDRECNAYIIKSMYSELEKI